MNQDFFGQPLLGGLPGANKDKQPRYVIRVYRSKITTESAKLNRYEVYFPKRFLMLYTFIENAAANSIGATNMTPPVFYRVGLSKLDMREFFKINFLRQYAATNAAVAHVLTRCQTLDELEIEGGTFYFDSGAAPVATSVYCYMVAERID